MRSASGIPRKYQRLLDILGYTNSPSFLTADRFGKARGAIYPLLNAAGKMGVFGAFGRWESNLGGRSSGTRFIPFVYLVTTTDEDAAREAHRKIWSQGLVPLVIFCTEDKVYTSVGFEFSYEKWGPRNTAISISELGHGTELPPGLEVFHARNLSSQIGLRDLAINPESRVDRRLLHSLKGLRAYLTTKGLSDPELVNLLIGRFLYLYALLDRELIPNDWLRPYGGIDSFVRDTESLTAERCWNLFDAIDHLLNGTVFPIKENQRHSVSDTHVRALRDCLKLGHLFDGAGQQISFLDFDLSTIQTETLSAIYEDFIDAENRGRDSSKRADGAFYTPPYLVDFLIDRVDENRPITAGVTILDGTAGSGAFLVAAFRRILEQSLVETNCRTLPATSLQKLLLASIFGIEKNASALAVAAFSLYLTMLDYADPAEVAKFLKGKCSDKLFPLLIGRNLLCEDIFDTRGAKPSAWPSKFSVILGNPPWNKIQDVTPRSQEVLSKYKDKIDGNEAAEAVLLTLVDRYIQSDGIAALVIPTKSLVGPSAKRFPITVSSEYTICGIANLSHLRYRLFEDARQPASILILANHSPSPTSTLWTYSPLRPQLIIDNKGDTWFLSLERSRVEYVRQQLLARDRDTLFAQLMLKPIDRHLRGYINDQIENRRFTALGDWLSEENLSFDRGGSPAQTNLPAEKLLGADKFKSNDFRQVSYVEQIDPDRQQQLISAPAAYSLTEEDLENVPAKFRRMFAGNILLVPRSMKGIAYCGKPIAFGSSLNAVYSSNPKATERAKLIVLGKYLSTDVAAYFFAIFGRQWILDQARLEKNDLFRIPFPFSGNWTELAKLSSEEFTVAVEESLALEDWARVAIAEYSAFRAGYHDGKIPTAFARPVDDSGASYQSVMSSVLRQVFPHIKVDLTQLNGRRHGNGDLRLRIEFDAKRQESHIDSATAQPTQLGDDELFRFSPNQWTGEIVKPNEHYRWTAESAYADSVYVLRLLAG